MWQFANLWLAGLILFAIYEFRISKHNFLRTKTSANPQIQSNIGSTWTIHPFLIRKVKDDLVTCPNSRFDSLLSLPSMASEWNSSSCWESMVTASLRNITRYTKQISSTLFLQCHDNFEKCLRTKYRNSVVVFKILTVKGTPCADLSLVSVSQVNKNSNDIIINILPGVECHRRPICHRYQCR